MWDLHQKPCLVYLRLHGVRLIKIKAVIIALNIYEEQKEANSGHIAYAVYGSPYPLFLNLQQYINYEISPPLTGVISSFSYFYKPRRRRGESFQMINH